jgi:hypothetical protein
MSRFDKFCLYMIPICLIAAFVVGVLQYRSDIRNETMAVNQTIPGCKSGKYVCMVSFRHGRPFVSMALRTLNK